MQKPYTVRSESRWATYYRAFADVWLCDNEFITDNNLAHVKPAVIRDKQHCARSENTLILSSFKFSWWAPKDAIVQ